MPAQQEVIQVAAATEPGAAGEQPVVSQYAAPVPAGERERLLWMYRTMLRIREFDERIVQLFGEGKIAGALHSYVGEEAVATGVCAHLRPDDYVVSTHRGHGHLLAKGGEMRRMMAELYGRVDGYCRGKGGSMHITAVELGMLGANGIVGAGVPIATGAGTAIHLKGTDQVVVCFFGDGAVNIGPFHEGLNLAATWNLPVTFVCENNLYAQFTPQRLHAKLPDLYLRAQGYGIPGLVVDGNDVLAVADVVQEAVARSRSGGGPTFIEAKTYRWHGHAVNNPASAVGRDEREIADWKAKDPIPRLAHHLLERGIATALELDSIRDEVLQEVEASIAFAEASPSAPPEAALEHVYAHLPPRADL
ncbi:MAG: thiamine pyrophosphate-dependent dehydrogenase E1 component subunit alpha [Chloroflexi bacterium]|nr:thiamine pyrophosphate-dependent dehydrogenase E1 component subunit alpha [Chloroflexota bacterium]